MKTAVCIVLTLALVSLPSGQVLAQTSPEAATAAYVSLIPEEGWQHAPGDSAPALMAALLWQPISENHTEVFEEPSFNSLLCLRGATGPLRRRCWSSEAASSPLSSSAL